MEIRHDTHDLTKGHLKARLFTDLPAGRCQEVLVEFDVAAW